MKKGFLVFLIFSLIFPVFSTNIPDQLCGIWEGKDRFVFFEQQSENENPELVIILKDYYGWYYERACEPQNYSEREKRVLNNSTHKTSEHVYIDFDNFYEAENKKSCSMNLILRFSKHEENYIPFAIIEDKLYIDFYKKILQSEENQNTNVSEDGLWCGNQNTSGFTLNSQKIDENIGLLIIDENKMFDVRYWKSDIQEKEKENLAEFIFAEKQYLIPKYIYSGNVQYSCVSGRSNSVRNPQKYFDFNKDDYFFNDEKNLMCKKNSEYLIKLADKNTFEQLMEIVKAANSRRKLNPPPLFPQEDLDWHWNLINQLEKDNELIKKVRERQNKFSSRGF